MSRRTSSRRVVHPGSGSRLSGQIVRALLPALALSGVAPAAEAQGTRRTVYNPPQINIQRGLLPKMTLMAVPQGASELSREAQLDLDIDYTGGKIYNPATGKEDNVRLRSYVGRSTPTGTPPYVAPTIVVAPGETVRITVNNKLDDDPSCKTGGDPNIPHCYNGTNLHTHGLWVSPSGNSDNVLLSINPGVSFQHEYNIPPDHPAGTFWYHPHRHGSTALQVSSGMAGALIIQGKRPPTLEANGDIDTLLKNADGQSMTERVLLFQQIQYACFDKKGVLKAKKDKDGKIVAWVCDETDTGDIRYDYTDPDEKDEKKKKKGLFGAGTWVESGRYTSINGLMLPTFEGARAGSVERWRMIHAGVHDTITLEFRERKQGAPSIDRLKASDTDQYIQKYCTGTPLAYHTIASDGLTMAQAQKQTVTTLQPGYRNDALVVFPKAGSYCVLDSSAPAAGSVNQAPPNRQLLGVVMVAPDRQVSNDVGEFLKSELVAAAERNMPESVKAKVVGELKDGLRLTSFVPHRTIEDSELTGTQQLTFVIDTSQGSAKFEIDDKPYDPNRIDRTLALGGVDEWTLTSARASHPFHIHVNPFQIVKILDPNGKDVSGPKAVDDAGDQIDPQYPGLKGVWKDTLMVKSLPPLTNGGKSRPYTVVVRTRYQRYVGDFVLHCHILDHEDQGMMQNIRIALPNGQGGVAHGHH